MSRRPILTPQPGQRTVLLQLRTSPQAVRLLGKLVRTGLFGTSVSAAAERLLLERLRELKDFPAVVQRAKRRRR